MQMKKIIDWVTLWHLTIHNHKHRCTRCDYYDECERYKQPPNCPIWQSLEDAPNENEHRLLRDCVDDIAHGCYDSSTAYRRAYDTLKQIQTTDVYRDDGEDNKTKKGEE